MMLCRKLPDSCTLCRTPFFPARREKPEGYRYRVFLGVGGNVGDTRRRMEHLWCYLRRQRLVRPLRSGAILRNPPFGYAEQNDFDNTVIEIATSLQPRALLRLVWRIEKRFGRKRSFPNAPRTLDLDILFFEDRVVQYRELIIPHPCWRERPSVTIPLGSVPKKRKRAWREYENLDI